MPRSTSAEDIVTAARSAGDKFVSFKSITDNGIYEAVRVGSVSEDEIEFDMSLIGMGVKSYPVSDIEYLET